MAHQFVFAIALNQHFGKQIQEIEVLSRWFQAKRVNRESMRFKTHVEVRSGENLGQTFIAPAEIENVGQRLIFLQVLDQEVQ